MICHAAGAPPGYYLSWVGASCQCIDALAIRMSTGGLHFFARVSFISDDVTHQKHPVLRAENKTCTIALTFVDEESQRVSWCYR